MQKVFGFQVKLISGTYCCYAFAKIRFWIEYKQWLICPSGNINLCGLLPPVLQMNGLRRNRDAIKNYCRYYKKNTALLQIEYFPHAAFKQFLEC